MKKIGVICLALVLALGALGVGYAMWDKTLTITATVQTGEVDAEFTEAFTDDDGQVDDVTKDGPDAVGLADDDGGPNPDAPPQDDPDLPGARKYDHWGPFSSEDPDESDLTPARKDKDVGRSTATIGADPQTASILIENAYPCYYTTAYFKLTNTGTVPVCVNKVYEHCSVDHWVSYDYLPGPPPSGTWEFHAASTWYEITPCVVKAIDFDNDQDPELNVHVTGIALGDQIDKGEFVWMDVDVHVKQDAKELAGVSGSGIPAYTFDEKVWLVQWNEYPYTGPPPPP